MGRKKDKKWPKDPEMVLKKAEEIFRESLKDCVGKEVNPRIKWKMQHRLNRMLKNIMFDLWAENYTSVIIKGDGSMEWKMEFPAWIVKLGEENAKIRLG